MAVRVGEGLVGWGWFGGRALVVPGANIHVVFDWRGRECPSREGHAWLGLSLQLGFGGFAGDGRPGRWLGRRHADGRPAVPRCPADHGAHGLDPRPCQFTTNLQPHHALLQAVHPRRLAHGVAMETSLPVHQGAPKGAGGVAVAAPVRRALSLLALRAAGAPGREGRVLGEEVEPVLVDVAPQPPGLPENRVVHKMVVSIAEGGVGGQVGNGGVPACGPGSFTQGVGETDGGWIVARHVGIRHGLVAVVLEDKRGFISELQSWLSHKPIQNAALSRARTANSSLVNVFLSIRK